MRGLIRFSLVVVGLISVLHVYAAGEVNVYSARKEVLIVPLLEQFESETGIEVNLISADADSLLVRMGAEANLSPADVFITVDAGRAERAKESGLLAPMDAGLLAEVPAQYVDSDRQWVALSLRARMIFYNKATANPEDMDTYAEIADPKNKGKLCIRSSGNIYNQSLTAAMIAQHGPKKTLEWSKGVVRNLARKPVGGDTDQIHAVAAGVCEFAVANSYYYGRMLASEASEDQDVVNKVGFIWPNQQTSGAHINASVAGIAKHAPNPDNAAKLIEFLLSPPAQEFYARINHEFPVMPGTMISDTMKSFGEFKADTLPLNQLGHYNKEAVKIMDRAGWL